MVELIGIDNGYGELKDSNGNRFKSAYSETEPISLSNTNQLTVDGKKYWIGQGEQNINTDKADSMVNKLCTLNSLALSNGNSFFIVAGLPISQYKKDKDKLKQNILSYAGTNISLNNGIEKTVRINDVFIYAQGLSSLYVANLIHNCIIVDVGSKTIDICYVEINNGNVDIIQYNTYFCGCLSLYSKLADRINIAFMDKDVYIKSSNMESIIINGLEIDGETINLNFLNPCYKEHFSEMLTDLQLNYPCRTVPILLTGGGAALLELPFKNRFPNVSVMKNNQFTNAYGYYQIGKQIFGERLRLYGCQV